MVKIEIDGHSLEVTPGSMIIEAADNAGFRIPRFCYHKKLSVAANCRMCLVEVGNAPKALPACATPVSDGMVVRTHSPKAIEAQKAVMEFLLINHPLDCPICDQGGECELQDVAMGYGADVSHFSEGKRSVKDKNLGPLIATDMTRCIQCTRCVRFGEEVAGVREMGATGRGEHVKIGTFIEKAVTSELSGNIIDVCPVGALTSKPFRFKARPWELMQRSGIAPHDALGSHLFWHVYRNQVMRVAPQENEKINEVWLSDRDRYSYQGFRSIDRQVSPRVREHGQWKDVSWDEAMHQVCAQLKKTCSEDGAEALGALVSSNETTEVCYLLQKIMRQLGSPHIDYRLKQQDFRTQDQDPLYPDMGLPIPDLLTQEVIVLIGSDIQREQPLLSARLVQATGQGTQVVVINPVDFTFAFPVAHRRVPASGHLQNALAAILKAGFYDVLPATLKSVLADIQPTAEEQAIAALLVQAKKTHVLLGQLALSHPELSQILEWVKALEKARGALSWGTLSFGANSAGAALAGAIPHRGPMGQSLSLKGKTVSEMIQHPPKVFLLCNFEPELDSVYDTALVETLKEADCVIAMTPYLTPELLNYADIILPTTPVSETAGTFVNANGLWHSFQAATQPLEQSKPLWKILRVMGQLLHLSGFEHNTAEEVIAELRALPTHPVAPAASAVSMSLQQPHATKALVRVGGDAIYSADNVVRRATALQEMQGPIVVRINAKTADLHRVRQAEEVCVNSIQVMPLVIDERVPDGAAWIPTGAFDTQGLGKAYGSVHLTEVNRHE